MVDPSFRDLTPRGGHPLFWVKKSKRVAESNFVDEILQAISQKGKIKEMRFRNGEGGGCFFFRIRQTDTDGHSAAAVAVAAAETAAAVAAAAETSMYSQPAGSILLYSVGRAILECMECGLLPTLPSI